MDLLKSLSLLLSRPPGETKALRNRKAQRPKSLFFAALLLGTFLAISLWLLAQSQRWKQMRVAVPLSPSQWHVVFDSEKDPKKNMELPKKGSPLWTAPLTRAAENYRQKLAAHGTQPFWVGIHIPHETLREAKTSGAEVLFLGRIYAKYTLFINGEAARLPREIDDELVLPQIRASEWENPNGLHLALRIENVNRYSYPELTVFDLGQIGFITSDQLGDLRLLINFGNWGRPLSFAALNLLIALTFFLFWYVDPLKQEYLWFAGYSLVHGITQALLVPAFILSLGKADKVLKLGLEAWEVTLPLILGFVFVRASQKWIRAMALGASSLSLLAAYSGFLYGMNTYLHNQLHPLLGIACGVLGAAVCLNEAYVTHGRVPRFRTYRLAAFAATLCFIAFLYWYLAARLYASDAVVVIWHRFAHLGAMVVMGFVMFSDVREMAEQMREVPWSKFHKNEQSLGKPVWGTVLAFDLKRSEPLMNHRESGLEPRAILREAMAPLRSAAFQAGLEFMDGAGDGFYVFYPETDFPPERVYDEVFPELWSAALRVTDSLANRGISPSGWETHFRAAVSFGSVVPVFTASGEGMKAASWDDGENSPLVDMARLEEAEKSQLDPRREESNILMSTFFVERLKEKGLDPGRLGSPVQIQGKHSLKRLVYRLRYQRTRESRIA